MERKAIPVLVLGFLLLALYGIWAVWKSLPPVPVPTPSRLPAFRMEAVTAKGHKILASQDFQGRPWVANFIFTHCAGPCPLLTAQMAKLQQKLPRQVRLVSFTVDPVRDTSEVLSGYALRVGADPERWFFLRGSQEELVRLVRDGFKLSMVRDPRAPSGFRVVHSTKFVLVDASGNIQGYYDSDEASFLESLSGDVRSLLHE